MKKIKIKLAIFLVALISLVFCVAVEAQVITDNDTVYVEATVPAQPNPPQTNDLDITNVQIDQIGTDEVRITWETDRPATGQVCWGTEEGQYDECVSSNDFETDHSFIIDDLEPGEEYYFQIISEDAATNQAVVTEEFELDDDDDEDDGEDDEDEDKEESPYYPYYPPIDETEEEEEDDEEEDYQYDDDEESVTATEETEEQIGITEDTIPEELLQTSLLGDFGAKELLNIVERVAKAPETKGFAEWLAASFALLSTLLLFSGISSVSQLGTAIFRIFALPFYKRKDNQGMVYDADTGQPLSLAVVSVLDKDQRVKKSKTTDKFGSYFFLIPAGEYTLKATRKDYRMVTKEELKELKVIYKEIYAQEQVLEFKKEGMINISIPMKKVEKTSIFGKIAKRSWFHAILDIVFYIGFALSLLVTSYEQSTWNIMVSFCYLFFFILRLVNFIKPHWGVVTKENNPESFAFVSAYSKKEEDGTNSPQARAITDEFGRYAFVLDKGTYSVEAKSANGEKEAKHNLVVKKRGIVGGKIKI